MSCNDQSEMKRVAGDLLYSQLSVLAGYKPSPGVL